MHYEAPATLIETIKVNNAKLAELAKWIMMQLDKKSDRELDNLEQTIEYYRTEVYRAAVELGRR